MPGYRVDCKITCRQKPVERKQKTLLVHCKYMLQVEFDFVSKWFNLGWCVISLYLVFIIIKRDKEITNQPRLKSFWPKIKLTCNIIYTLPVLCYRPQRKKKVIKVFLAFVVLFSPTHWDLKQSLIKWQKPQRTWFIRI